MSSAKLAKPSQPIIYPETDGIRFESGETTELRLFRADGQRFFTMQQLESRRSRRTLGIDLRAREQTQLRADQAQQRAEQAQRLAEQERLRVERAELRAAQLQDKLRAAGINLVDE